MSAAPRPALLLRLARADDLAAVRHCAERAYERYVDRIGRRPAPMDAPFGRQIAAAEIVVAVVEGQVAGYVVRHARGDHIHIENIAVLPERHGQGIGRRLLESVEAEARAAGRAALELYTNQKMTENLAFYARLGYRETGRREEAGFSRVFFRKELAPIPGRSG